MRLKNKADLAANKILSRPLWVEGRADSAVTKGSKVQYLPFNMSRSQEIVETDKCGISQHLPVIVIPNLK